jgi:hypothetical protein
MRAGSRRSPLGWRRLLSDQNHHCFKKIKKKIRLLSALYLKKKICFR